MEKLKELLAKMAGTTLAIVTLPLMPILIIFILLNQKDTETLE